MLQYFHDVNANVEEQDRYGSDSVMLKLDETTFTVTVEQVDVYENVISGKAKIVDEDFDDLKTAISYYEEVAHQLAQGDVIRNYNRPGVVGNSYDFHNSRY